MTKALPQAGGPFDLPRSVWRGFERTFPRNTGVIQPSLRYSEHDGNANSFGTAPDPSGVEEEAACSREHHEFLGYPAHVGGDSIVDGSNFFDRAALQMSQIIRTVEAEVKRIQVYVYLICVQTPFGTTCSSSNHHHISRSLLEKRDILQRGSRTILLLLDHISGKALDHDALRSPKVTTVDATFGADVRAAASAEDTAHALAERTECTEVPAELCTRSLGPCDQKRTPQTLLDRHGEGVAESSLEKEQESAPPLSNVDELLRLSCSPGQLWGIHRHTKSAERVDHRPSMTCSKTLTEIKEAIKADLEVAILCLQKRLRKVRYGGLKYASD